MADQEQQPEGQQVEEKLEVADQFAEADDKADPNDDPAPNVEDIASRMGWVPKDKFRGEESDWKPADKFILDGNDIKSAQSRELKEMRRTLDTVARTTGAVMAERLKSQADALAAKYEGAVERGDTKEAAEALREHDQVMSRAQSSTASEPAAEAIQWVDKNAWMKPGPSFDPVAAQRAVQICDQYAKAGLPAADQVAKTEAVMRREFPHLFPDTATKKDPPGVNEPAARTAMAQKRGKTAADMPKVHKDIASDLLDRGLIKDTESYARNYFAQTERMQ